MSCIHNDKMLQYSWYIYIYIYFRPMSSVPMRGWEGEKPWNVVAKQINTKQFKWVCNNILV